MGNDDETICRHGETEVDIRISFVDGCLFDDVISISRRELATRDVEQRKRKREEELSAEAQAALEREWQRNFEESRQSRVDSWKAFQSGSGTSSATKQKKPKKMKTFKPPKTKAESR